MLKVPVVERLVRIKNPFVSFFKENFNTNSIKLAIIFSLPIYLNAIFLYSNLEINFLAKTLFSLNTILFIYLLFKLDFKFFGFGFFSSILWFYWISLSFRYYNLDYLIPIVILIIGIFYGFIFFIIEKIYLKIQNIYLKKIFLALIFSFIIDYISPFTFDWFKIEVLFINSFFKIDKLSIFLLFLSIAFLKETKFLSLIVIPFLIDFKTPKKPHLPLKIYISNTHIPQAKKWKEDYLIPQIDNNFKIIKKAIKEKYDVVVLPESAFPMFLNEYSKIENYLKFLSKKITILTGALNTKNNNFYNASYLFKNEKEIVMYKHILVPFGEYIPFPFFKDEINKIFFDGSSDYQTSKSFSTFKIKNIKFINAICYEITTEDIYKLKPKYIIAISNNGWFTPSIEPSLQEMIIKIYAKKYKKVVFHSVNDSPSYTIYY